jgi:hypothetical protein
MTPVRLGTRLLLPSGDLKLLVEEVVAAIDGLHAVLDLPLVPVVYSDTADPYAQYDPGDRHPVIYLSRRGPYPRLSLAHEIGHLLDHALGEFGVYSSTRRSSPLAGIMRAVTRSAAVTRFQALRTGRAPLRPGERLARIDYWLQPQELWARVYAQYIATCSDSESLLSDVELARELEHLPNYRNVQWDREDFTPIAAAIDAAFLQMGWRS